ncbi:MAG: hypothetical protein AAF566_13290 [Pseudomonadota bacterium]
MDKTTSGIVCALTQSEFRKRTAEVRESLTVHLIASTYAQGSARLAFRRPAVSRGKLEHLIEREQTCCPFLRFDIRETDTDIMLIVSGPEGSEGLVRDLFSLAPTACGAWPSQSERATDG